LIVNLAPVVEGKIANRHLVGRVFSTEAADPSWVRIDTSEPRASLDGTHGITRYAAAPAGVLAKPAAGAVHVSPATQKYHAQRLTAVVVGKNLLFEKPATRTVPSLPVSHEAELHVHPRDWRPGTLAAGGGAFADLTAHELDTAGLFLGEDRVSRVAGSAMAAVSGCVRAKFLQIAAAVCGAARSCQPTAMSCGEIL
jgi:predicted dehydrogenase